VSSRCAPADRLEQIGEQIIEAVGRGGAAELLTDLKWTSRRGCGWAEALRLALPSNRFES
jgi:hypothetical protein